MTIRRKIPILKYLHLKNKIYFISTSQSVETVERKEK